MIVGERVIKSYQIIYVLENPLQTSDHWKFTIIPPSRPGLFLSICQPFPLAAQFSFCRLQAGSAWALCKVLHHASAGSFHLFNWDPQPLKTSCRRTPEMSEKRGEGKLLNYRLKINDEKHLFSCICLKVWKDILSITTHAVFRGSSKSTAPSPSWRMASSDHRSVV